MLTPLVTAIFASAVVLSATFPLLRARVLDVPNDRSSHVAPVPRAGGIAIVAGAFAGVLALSDSPEPYVTWQVGTALIGLAGLGLWDDVRPLGVKIRLVGQLACAALLISTIWPAGLGSAIGVMFVVGYVNATNFMDGINGITAAISISSAVYFSIVLQRVGEPTLAAFAACLAAAIVPFAVANVSGWIFMGDVGSYFLGGAVAALSVMVWREGAPLHVAVAPTAVVVLDTVWTLIRRTVQGHQIGAAHRDHVYQRLVTAGWSHLQTATLVLLITGAVQWAAWQTWSTQLGVAYWTAITLLLLGTYLTFPILARRRARAR
jgi:UDP-GlcNAc:undecaprenyl-phosphate GlcNAc-1-phosphate transferase